jgi:hypothetical protein
MLLVLFDVYKGWILPLAPGSPLFVPYYLVMILKYTYYNAEWSPLSLTAQTFSSVNLFINYWI